MQWLETTLFSFYVIRYKYTIFPKIVVKYGNVIQFLFLALHRKKKIYKY